MYPVPRGRLLLRLQCRCRTVEAACSTCRKVTAGTESRHASSGQHRRPAICATRAPRQPGALVTGHFRRRFVHRSTALSLWPLDLHLMATMSTSRSNSSSLTSTAKSSSSLNVTTSASAHFTTESMKLIAESVGISNLADTAAKFLADHITQRLKTVVAEGTKFQIKAKRKKLMPFDVDHALRCLNVEPVYGFSIDPAQAGLPFRMASGGGRELIFPDAEKEIDLLKLASNTALPKVPPEIALRAHWLCIEGIQPAIPENPPPVSKQEQRLESIDPLAAVQSATSASNPSGATGSAASNAAIHRRKRLETVKLKQYATHELSVEQQLYYKEITEACVGSDEGRRAEALHSLAYDNGLHQMLPRLCTFISEGVKVNVVQNNLALLIYLMRMVKAILDNTSLYLEKYLHEILPTIVTCIVSKQLCMRPDVDNHWALRDFAARLLAQTSKTYNTSTNCIQIRLTRTLTKAIDNNVPLSSVYGALSALCELGADVQRTLVLRRIKLIGERISDTSTRDSSIGETKAAIEHIKTLILRVIPNTLRMTRPQPDVLEEYRNEFGPLFGPLLHSAVVKARSSTASMASPTGPAGASDNRLTVRQVGGGANPIATSSTGSGGQMTRIVILQKNSAGQQVQPHQTLLMRDTPIVVRSISGQNNQ